MFLRLENNFVVETFDDKPKLHAAIMRSIIEMEGEVGDLIDGQVNRGAQPSDFHFVSGGRWVENEELKNSNSVSVAKLEGFEFSGVKCSATSEDQNGLVAVWLDFKEGEFQPTNFRFQNGNVLELNASNIESFSSQWRAFRRGFFV